MCKSVRAALPGVDMISVTAERTHSKRGDALTGSLALALRRLLIVVSMLCAGGLALPRSAEAFEAIDGRVQAHGYFEMQIRSISKNYSDDWDVTQWYNIFNLELEFDLVQETHGPLDLLSAYMRIEARFDCIYSRGCGMIPGIDAYGNRSRSLPSRLNREDEYTFSGQIPVSNDGPYANRDNDPLTIVQVPGFSGIYEATPEGLGGVDRTLLVQCGTPLPGTEMCSDGTATTGFNYDPGKVPYRFWEADRNRRAAAADGTAIDDGTDGAPYLLALNDFHDFKFAAIPVLGGSGNGHAVQLMGPWLPDNVVQPNAALANLMNPLDSSRVNVGSLTPGSGSNPMRPIPILREDDPERLRVWVNSATTPQAGDPRPGGTKYAWEVLNPSELDVREWNDRKAKDWEARGLFMPSQRLRKAIQEGKIDSYPFNFSEEQRAFNRGASQQDEGELKEAYFDIEMFDSRLWMRIGKQSIVWGKTELFRTTDQFNPQDFALATLPSLEESRINLWALRGVWSFYEVGPLSDVRVELAMNFDQFESADLGACGEPYTINLVCSLTFGAWAHGMTGIGIAGVEQPANPWDDPAGIEFGGRIEWRWDRFSFALSDFYGFDDFPHVVRLSTYNRNVDWRTGRARHYMHEFTSPYDTAANVSNGCATPDGAGVLFNPNPLDPSQPDLTRAPIGGVSLGAASIRYDGAENGGCLTPGATNRQVRVHQGANVNEYYGTPYRVSYELVEATHKNNRLLDYTGQFLNTSSRSDPNDPRFYYSSARNSQPGDAWQPGDQNDPFDTFINVEQDGAQSGSWDWNGGPHEAATCGYWYEPTPAEYASLCAPKPDAQWNPSNPSTPTEADWEAQVRTYVRPGARAFDEEKYAYDTSGNPIIVNGEQLLNPDYNPYYDPRLDRYFDARAVRNIPNASNFRRFRYFGDPTQAASPAEQVNLTAQVFDPFYVYETPQGGAANGHKWWGNAYDPTLQYDERNALDLAAVNQSVFNWVCATTVGFSDLDPSACAMTVFSSSKQASDGQDTRISTVIGAFLSGDPVFNQIISTIATDEILSKGPTMPTGMGMPLVGLNGDFEILADTGAAQVTGLGLAAFRTEDSRRSWADRAAGTLPGRDDPAYPWIYARDGESYNCIGTQYELAVNQAPQLCGGLSINISSNPGGQALDGQFRVATYLSKSLTPEQEALLGCGPYFGTACDSNGIDLLHAEGSALLQSFLGSDSLGISFETLGIAGLVPAEFGAMLSDNGSASEEYRTDGRVLGSNYRLLRIDVDPANAENNEVALGTDGYLRGTYNENNFGTSLGGAHDPCEINTDSLLDANGAVNNTTKRNRMSARCWDLRPYYRAYGLQPGTATFEILQIGGPKCTTADIGGPEGNGGVLPGCRNKWETILFEPLAGWTPDMGLDPNNPLAGYIGNNHYGQVMSYKAAQRFETSMTPRPRTDYRQWRGTAGQELADLYPTQGGCTNVVGGPNPTNPGSYDCYRQDPTTGSFQAGATVRYDPSWSGYGIGDVRYTAAEASRRSGLNWGEYNPVLSGCAVADTNDPDCYIGGWRQTIDGEPDRVGLNDRNGGIINPTYVQATSGQIGPPELWDTLVFEGERVETGCTTGNNWAYIQRLKDPTTGAMSLLPPSECAEVFINPYEDSMGNRWPNVLRGGAGHPFTGESFSSELAGVSWNFMMLLVSFSDDFRDGLASVRGFVAPEVYESRYIYDEEWMWNTECDGVQKTAADCGGRLFQPADLDQQPSGATPLNYYSRYGDPNRGLDGEDLRPDGIPYPHRLVAGWRSTGIGNGDYNSRRTWTINPLPEGMQNKLQRDPSLPNILTMFPDLTMRECPKSVKANTVYGVQYDAGDPGQCQAESDWVVSEQEKRLGRGGMIETMMFDYAFTGTENDLMALIPYCEDLSAYTQRHTLSGRDDGSTQTDVEIWGPNRIDCTRGEQGETLGRARCTYITPQNCDLVQALFSIAGQKRNIARAGGNGRFGRRTMQWQSGGDVFLSYERRNVLGFSTDFAEDYTKSNWSMEFTWIEGVPAFDNDSYDLTTRTDNFNLTVSMDRPTFVNFLNANRTFFINSQWFFQYRKGYTDGMPANGPWNVLATFAVFTGYFQDRLNPMLVFVYDFRSVSGGALPQVSYRFSENFQITVGASLFWGKQDLADMPVNGIAPAGQRSGPNAYRDSVENGLSLVRDRDEVFMSLRYTF